MNPHRVAVAAVSVAVELVLDVASWLLRPPPVPPRLSPGPWRPVPPGALYVPAEWVLESAEWLWGEGEDW